MPVLQLHNDPGEQVPKPGVVLKQGVEFSLSLTDIQHPEPRQLFGLRAYESLFPEISINERYALWSTQPEKARIVHSLTRMSQGDRVSYVYVVSQSGRVPTRRRTLLPCYSPLPLEKTADFSLQLSSYVARE